MLADSSAGTIIRSEPVTDDKRFELTSQDDQRPNSAGTLAQPVMAEAAAESPHLELGSIVDIEVNILQHHASPLPRRQ